MITVGTSLDKKTAFTGLANKIPSRRIFDATDAIAQWQVLKHPKYTNIYQEEEFCTSADYLYNRNIRRENYSFLNELKSDKEKAKFIEHFKQVTGFPSLAESSAKILEEFKRVIHLVDNKLKSRFRSDIDNLFIDNNVNLIGYDRFCSAGLGTSLPGSDLDKGYAILRGVDGDLHAQKKYSDAFKELIWENIDNRIMSVNHMSAFPNIMTDKELFLNLEHVDKVAEKLVRTNDDLHYFKVQRLSNPHLVPAARFNIWLTKLLGTTKEKYDAKNLAYIVEAIRDGNHLELGVVDEIYRRMQASRFSWCSNICSGYRMEQKAIYSDILKTKLKARKAVEKEFENWSISKQYELVKDVIRSMSGDNMNPEFQAMFKSPNDRHRLLLNDILRGKVDCDFYEDEYVWRAELKYSTPELESKYKDLNLYNFEYDSP